jgi:phosphoglycerate dehydrogenase-like enzyme
VTRVAILDDYSGLVRALPHWTRLDRHATVESFTDTLTDEQALARRLEPFDVVVGIRERTRFSASLLARLPNLKHIALGGRHTGQVDLEAAGARGIVVSETGGSAVNATELTIALMTAVVRRLPQEDRNVREGRWQTGLGVDLAGKTLGVVGLGKIGSRIAAFGAFLGMRVLASGITLTAERAAQAGAVMVDLDTLMRDSDVVSLHLRLSDRTRGLVTARHLALMKPTAYLVNTARGPLVDEAALVAALRERRIAGAALDVYDVEPLPKSHPLLGLDTVVLTPHVGFVTREGYDVFFSGVVDNIEAALVGKSPPGVVKSRDRA